MDLVSMSLDTSKSNLTEISNSADTLHFRNYLSAPNKHQTDIDNKTAPTLSSAMPPPPRPPPLWDLEK